MMLAKMIEWAINGLADSLKTVEYNEAVSQWHAEKMELLSWHQTATSCLLTLLRSEPRFKEGQDFWMSDRFIALSVDAVQWCKEKDKWQYEMFIKHQGALDGANGLKAELKDSPYLEEWQKWHARRQSVLNLKSR